VELVSILFHLARAPEYSRPAGTPYHQAVDEHFGPFQAHPAVAATRALRAEHGISHNAPIDLAVLLDPGKLEPNVPLDEAERDLDKRWRGVDLGDYLPKVRDFAAASGFAAFFAAQEPYRRRVEERLAQAIADHGILTWFEGALGPIAAEVHLVPGLLTGPWSYEATAHDANGRHVYEVVELERPDRSGLPTPTTTTLDLIVHEMAHSYVNPHVERQRAAYSVAVPLFERIAPLIAGQGYTTWQLLVEESLVRAVTVWWTYQRLGPDAAHALDVEQQHSGFQWIAALAAVLMKLAEPGGPVRLDEATPTLAAFFADLSERARASI
jgi:hypothetical protein